MFLLARKDSVEYLESTALKRCDFLLHAFCTRWSGVSEGHFSSLNVSAREGDEECKVLQNKEIIASAFKLRADQFFTVHQVHSDDVLFVNHHNIDFIKQGHYQCDAVITDKTGLALSIKTADCTPVFLVDQEKKAIGVVHAGWRGTSLNIVSKAVSMLSEAFSSRPEDIIAAIGPSIGPCCYQVDEVVYQANRVGRNWEAAFSPCREKGKWMFDLPAANRLQLLKAGLPHENIVSSDICTCCRRDIFFTHRGANGKTGRQINFIMLKENC